MRGVGRDALRAVGGDRVAEIDMLGHVRGREDDTAAEPAPTPASPDGSVVADGGAGPVVARDSDCPVITDGGDGPDVAVAHPVPAGQGEVRAC